MIRRPFNLKKWIEENRSLLQPPVGNKNLYVESEDYVIMIVGGPNARKDYHYNETEEWFFQVEGSVMIGVQEDGKAVDIEVKEGEMFLLPPRTPHQPRRGEGTVGIVIEVKQNVQVLRTCNGDRSEVRLTTLQPKLWILRNPSGLRNFSQFEV
jgi:3-hydroxyanthranilate 3,4-dioxygenase